MRSMTSRTAENRRDNRLIYAARVMGGKVGRWVLVSLNSESQRRHPEGPRFHQRAEGSPVARSLVAGDPSLRLKNGCAQDDAVTGTATRSGFKLRHSSMANSARTGRFDASATTA